VESTFANISALLLYGSVNAKEANADRDKNMPFYPCCNMRSLSEMNMTETVNSSQKYTMEQIMKNEKGEAREYDLSPFVALTLYELNRKSSEKHSKIISAGIVDQGDDDPSLVEYEDRFAKAVTVKQLRSARNKLKIGKEVTGKNMLELLYDLIPWYEMWRND